MHEELDPVWKKIDEHETQLQEHRLLINNIQHDHKSIMNRLDMIDSSNKDQYRMTTEKTTEIVTLINSLTNSVSNLQIYQAEDRGAKSARGKFTQLLFDTLRALPAIAIIIGAFIFYKGAH